MKDATLTKLNGTRQVVVYVDDVNMLRGSVHTIKENTEAPKLLCFPL